jgi:hypothetical protein
VPTNGDINLIGRNGEVGYRSTGTFGWSGRGANSMLGSGGNSKVAAGAGSSGAGFGSGAGGCCVINGSAAVIGGIGGPGVWILTQYT